MASWMWWEKAGWGSATAQAWGMLGVLHRVRHTLSWVFTMLILRDPLYLGGDSQWADGHIARFLQASDPQNNLHWYSLGAYLAVVVIGVGLSPQLYQH